MTSDVQDGLDIADMSVIFLGAGFSRAASDGAAPLMSDFFDGLDRDKYGTLHAFLSRAFPTIERPNVEEVLLNLDQLRATPVDEPLFQQTRIRHGEVRTELSRYCIERLGKLTFEPRNWAAALLANVADDATVITTNYDNLADRILSNRPGIKHFVNDTNCPHCKTRRLLENNPVCDSSDGTLWQGSLLKLHGSVAWQICRNQDCKFGDKLVTDIHCRPISDFKCWECRTDIEPGIILPDMSKSYDRYPQLRQMWAAARLALCNAEAVMVIGFSFPTSDASIRQLFRTCLCRAPRLKTIAILDIDPGSVADRLERLLAEAARDKDIHCYTYEVPKDRSEPSWLVAGNGLLPRSAS